MNLLNLFGWKIEGKIPEAVKKSVVCIAPHTSYWDGFLGLLAMWSLGINFLTISAKHLFSWWPMSWIMKYIFHAIPADGKILRTIVKEFRRNSKINLIICPEGTVSFEENWNMGFLKIAKTINVPIILVAFNYKLKTIYICNEVFYYNESESRIREFYDKYAYAKYPEKFSNIKEKGN